MSFPANMLYTLIRRRQPLAQPAEPAEDEQLLPARRQSDDSFGRIAPVPSKPAPYDTPDPTGKCWLLDLPEEVLVRVFERLDRVTLARCARVCRTLSDLLNTNPHLALQSLLSFSSLTLNPHALRPSTSDPTLVPPAPAELLKRLQDRLARFERFDPLPTRTGAAVVRLKEPEGRLYEYLEGILLRSVGSGGVGTMPREVAVYDLRKLRGLLEPKKGRRPSSGQQAIEGVAGEQSEAEAESQVGEDVGDDEADWESVDESDELADKIRRTKKFPFEVAEFAVDPGQDLLVIVEVKTHGPRSHSIHFHLLSLETFEPHPLARHSTLEWPSKLHRRNISLGFQICDDGLFVLNHNIRSGQYDQICGWQWTTGRLAVTLKAFPTMTFESFILLSPNSILVPTIITHLDPESDLQADLNNPVDLSWTHHMHLYAFPPFSSVPSPVDPSEPVPPPHSVTHIATFDLPEFDVDINGEMPPPRMTIRTDPPPRHTMPTHPEDRIQPFAPNPDAGVIILEFFCQLPGAVFPHYVMACPKKTLIQYLPAPTSPLLVQAFPRPAPVVLWDTLAPKVRLFGPDLKSSSWVCYVYQDRFVLSTSTRRGPDDPPDYNAKARLYDFNPLRVKREVLRRTDPSPAPPSTETPSSALGTSPSSPPPPKRRSILRRLSSSLSGASSSSGTGAAATTPTVDGERNGTTLITAETILQKRSPLLHEVKTGRDFPYTFVEKKSDAEVFLLDEERIVAVHDSEEDDAPRWRGGRKSRFEVWDF